MLNKYILKLFQVSLRECRNIYIKVPFIQKDLREVEITKNKCFKNKRKLFGIP